MPGMNRFYTPSLPEYTSQFVEDQTPWDEMIALENLKLNRTDQAMQSADDINTSLAQIIPGARTGPTAEAVKSEYTQAVDQWMQKYKDDSYSAPSLRDLTKINSRWKQDPRVTKIIRDREETPMYLQQRAQMDNRDIDPNIDPETGEIIPLSDDQEFQSFQPILRAEPFENQLLSDLRSVDVEDQSGNVVKTITDPETGQKIKGIVNVRTNKRGDEQLDPALETIADRIEDGTYASAPWVKAMLGPDATRDDIVGFLGGYKKQAYVDDYQEGGFSVLESKDADDDDGSVYDIGGSRVDLTAEFVSPTNNFTDLNAKDVGPERGTKRDVRKVNRWEEKVQPAYMELMSNKQGFIPPEVLTKSDKSIETTVEGKAKRITPFEDNFFTDVLTQAEEKKGLIYKSLNNNYAGTKESYKEYYNRYDNKDEFKEAGEEGSWLNYNSIKNELEDYFKQYDTAKGYDTPNENIFKNGLNTVAAQNAVLMSGALTEDPSAPFGTEAEDPVAVFAATDPKDYTGEQKLWVSKISDNFSSSDRALTVRPKGILMNEDQQELIENTYIGKTTDANSSIPSGTIKRELLGAHIVPIRYGGKSDRKQPKVGKQLSKDDKEDMWTDAKGKKEVRIGSWIDEKTSTWGPGKFSMTIGQDLYAVEAPEDFVEPQRLSYNIGSASWKHSLGNGAVFAIQGYDQTSGSGAPYTKVVDQWNQDQEDVDQTSAVWMQVQHDHTKNQVNLLLYNKDPRSLSDRPQEYDDYTKVPLKRSSNQDVGEQDLEALVNFYYNAEMAGRLSDMYKQNQDPSLIEGARDYAYNLVSLAQNYPNLFEYNQQTGEVTRK